MGNTRQYFVIESRVSHTRDMIVVYRNAYTHKSRGWGTLLPLENLDGVHNTLMVIIRDIVSDFSDEDEIELCGDEQEDVEIDSNEPDGNITYANSSCFFAILILKLVVIIDQGQQL
ncbi:unnamed protein product [Lupinus luteus]|uniref:Uncharacterized protein n=1 Tax=Lupinus luteus TaxID=3873 RepID=A0AAV1XP25_LUPLU